MSFTELLEAAKALPRAEQLQLVEAIRGHAAELTIEERLLGLAPDSSRSGHQFDIGLPEHQPEAIQALRRAMNRNEHDVV